MKWIFNIVQLIMLLIDFRLSSSKEKVESCLFLNSKLLKFHKISEWQLLPWFYFQISYREIRMQILVEIWILQKKMFAFIRKVFKLECFPAKSFREETNSFQIFFVVAEKLNSVCLPRTKNWLQIEFIFLSFVHTVCFIPAESEDPPNKT